ncbi:DNA-3-methyladenine glycosylase I [Paenibacillus qinlingensis]|uniref:DNA-3-methyladenine glycosylase I n=1 Tax=Paenibacillus qinlingensis TaxID=1837343 RepID=UPI0015635BD9|nr:DNA-3-methyladenine glycosylase I [Paenibacillus qinlingensis]NQX58502.1 DNA-3-methyladenine glycosylase I [Paenibacillus qinlingensis]
MTNRCGWVNEDPLYQDYHDHEWGVPVHDDRILFEMLNLEGAQAGLSWYTILKKRAAYREAFDGFDPHVIVNYDEAKLQDLLQNPGIVRNRLKIASVVGNAKAFLKVQQEFGTFDSYIWSFVGGETIKNNWEDSRQLPAKTDISDRMSKDLKKRGFKFVGSTICYAYMQAVGMVNDHSQACFRYHNE